MNMINKDTPIWQLTVGEFSELMASLQQPTTDEWVRGWQELSDRLQLSTRTLCEYNKRGLFGDAVKSDGRTVFVRVEQAVKNLLNSKL
jgi:hypothetical protein